MNIALLVYLTYIISAACFILSLMWLNDPKTSRRGCKTGQIGMLLAIVGTLIMGYDMGQATGRPFDFTWIAVATVLGAIVGVPMAVLMPMTAVPQRTALSHAFGALAAGLVGTAEFYLRGGELGTFGMSALMLEIILGYLTFTGSLMAFGKLQGIVWDRPLTYPGQNFINLSVLATAFALGVWLVIDPSQTVLFPIVVGLSLLFGFFLIIPIGGADMPTVIALLNSYAGLSAAAMGFMLEQPILIIAGSLDGSSGLILSIIMCKAMNRSFLNVLFGAVGQDLTAGGGVLDQRTVKSFTYEEAAQVMENSSSVIVIPGYGMAVAQAQHKVRELYDVLTQKGVDVKFAIHPVAGRMPGHMNVLLAEADIPYDKLLDMDEINPEFPQTDVALVLGANDVVNPAARYDKNSPIYGMPILDADKAKTVLVNKRSMKPGFAGVDNELFYAPNTNMVFGDAKGTVGAIVTALKEM
jgi:NAD(P) transhydrogenase subunit beta